MAPKSKSQVIAKPNASIPKASIPKASISKASIPKKKGGAKSVDDADIGSDDDYITDDKSNDEEEEIEDIEEEENVNSDDDLEHKDEEEDEEAEADEESEESEEEEEVGDDGDCLYRFTGKKKKAKDILADIEVEDDFFEDEQIETNTFIEPSKRITKKYMTIYERVRVLGERAKQLSLGAKPLIKGAENLDPKTVAKMELEKKVIPLIIIRTLPNGQKEKWRVSELEIIN
jgi:DNA-directed RNA polymerase subunit K/omega